MTTLLRIGLEMTSIASVLMAGWLASVVLLVLPVRDPGHIQLWAAVAIATAALVAVTLLAIRRGRAIQVGLAVALALLALAAVGFGLFVLASALMTAIAGDPEGYLFAIGAILTAQGGLGLAWLASVAVSRAR
jgi:hypothetical protein